MKLQPITNSVLTPELLADWKTQVKNMDNQVELPVIHHHVESTPNSPCGGVYARELFIPAGTVAVGAVHKYPQLNIMSQGLVDIATTDGVFRLKAPYTTVAPAGIQRIVYAIEDTVWITIHGIDEKDEDVIWNTVVCEDFDKYIEFKKEQKLLEEAI